MYNGHYCIVFIWFFPISEVINSKNGRCRRLARRQRKLMARAQIDASSPVVRRGGDSAMGRGDPVLPGLLLAARRERWREIPTGTRSFPPFILPSPSQIHCRSLVLPGGTMGSENQQSAAAARDLLIASTTSQW